MPKGIPKNGINNGQFKKGKKPWNFGLKGIQTGWNRGLTKETNESIRRTSEKLTGRKLTKEQRIKSGNAKRGISLTEKHKLSIGIGSKKWFENPKNRKKHREAMNRPEIKKKCARPQLGRNQKKEERKKRKNSLIKHYKENPETLEKTKRFGSDNGMWNNGSSYLPYSPEWTEKLKEKIRQRDDYVCQECGRTQKEELKEFNWKLPVHHIDYDKMNCSEKNLILVCTRCNFRANTNRKEWTKKYRKKIIQIYAKITQT